MCIMSAIDIGFVPTINSASALLDVWQGLPNAIPEPAARFYAAAVVLGLEYMQRRDLVWRCTLRAL
jgi:hypothetical protein